MKNKLDLVERFTIIDLIPKRSDYVMLKQYHDLKIKLSLQPEEVKKFKVQVVGENLSWDKTIDTNTEIELSEVQIDIIKKALRELDDNKKLEEKHFSLYKKIFKI